jgi:hypothetical protein
LLRDSGRPNLGAFRILLNRQKRCSKTERGNNSALKLAIISTPLLLLLLNPGSGSEIRDPGTGMDKNQDPGSGITSRICNTAIKTRYRTIPKENLLFLFRSSYTCSSTDYNRILKTAARIRFFVY